MNNLVGLPQANVWVSFDLGQIFEVVWAILLDYHTQVYVLWITQIWRCYVLSYFHCSIQIRTKKSYHLQIYEEAPTLGMVHEGEKEKINLKWYPPIYQKLKTFACESMLTSKDIYISIGDVHYPISIWIESENEHKTMRLLHHALLEFTGYVCSWDSKSISKYLLELQESNYLRRRTSNSVWRPRLCEVFKLKGKM